MAPWSVGIALNFDEGLYFSGCDSTGNQPMFFQSLKLE